MSRKSISATALQIFRNAAIAESKDCSGNLTLYKLFQSAESRYSATSFNFVSNFTCQLTLRPLHQPSSFRAFHTSGTIWQQLKQTDTTKPTIPPIIVPTTLNTTTTTTTTTAPSLPRGILKQDDDDEVDAEECDEALEDLTDTRRRVSAFRRPPPGHVPLKKRIMKLSKSAYNGIKWFLAFTASIPGRTARFAALPRAERKAAYADMWLVVKKEAKHYWIGTKLLGKDAKIASRLVFQVLRGKQLSRRERQQLTRTTADIFRLVPMLVFVVIPFMELLLPVALKIFPNMLPSTFEDKLKKEEEMKRIISARLDLARFLQDTVQEMASDMSQKQSGQHDETRTSAAELYQFMKRVRAGEPVSAEELLKFAKLFSDELTLDNLERVQLVSLCRFVGIQPFGTDPFLRARLRAHLNNIKEDDKDIQTEGMESLSEDELRQACRARGMRTPFGEGAIAFMRDQLAEWLDWSLNRNLPSSLLLLSRAFTMTSPIIGPRGAAVDEVSIRDTLSTMSDEAVEDVELFATSTDGADKTQAYERKLELLEREEELIKEEREAEKREEKEMLMMSGVMDETKTRDTAGGDGAVSTMPSATTAQQMTAAAAAAAVVREAAAEAAVDHLEGESEEEKAFRAAAVKAAKMRKVITALAALASKSGVAAEREDFMELVQKEIDRLNDNLGSSANMVFTKGNLAVKHDAALNAALGQKALEERVAGILSRVERELDDADTKIGDRMRLLDLDNDGIISMEELGTAMSFLKEQMGEDELRTMLERLASEAGANGGIDVGKLMDLAEEMEETAEDGDK
jgi:LETM1 and EF-hand domain-containing protein 1, mitochondrial